MEKQGNTKFTNKKYKRRRNKKKKGRPIRLDDFAQVSPDKIEFVSENFEYQNVKCAFFLFDSQNYNSSKNKMNF